MAQTPRIERLAATMTPIMRMIGSKAFARRGTPGVADFMLGNPHELALPAFVDVLTGNLRPRDASWFAYKLSEPEATGPVAASLSRSTGLPWDPADIFMTNAGFGALAVSARAVTEPGDEIVFLSPPWFFYELLIAAAEAVPVRVALRAPDFELDAEDIAAAITPRTAAVLINSPHNPTGRVYSLDELRRLATVLDAASRRINRPIYLISDEPYRRIVFDGVVAHSPAEVYANTIVTYSYAKILMAPGQRLGYIGLAPTMPDRPAMRNAIQICQIATGYAVADALMQHSVAELEDVGLDLVRLQARRDRLVGALRAMGYEATMPAGTFYVMVRSPIDDDVAFSERLADRDVLVLPGTIVELPGWFRLSLTANDEMVEQALPVFASMLREFATA